MAIDVRPDQVRASLKAERSPHGYVRTPHSALFVFRNRP